MTLRKMILYVANSPELGGANISLLMILDHLDRGLYDPIVVYPADGPMVTEMDRRSIPCVIIPNITPSKLWPFSFFEKVYQYRKLIQQFKIDIVHVNDIDAYLLIGFALKRNSLPCVCHVRFPFSEIDLTYIARHTRWPNVLLFNSFAIESQLGSLVEKHMPGIRKTVIHNSLDTELFNLVEDTCQAKVHHGIEPTRHVVSIIANFTPAKDHETFLYVAKEILSVFPDTLFILAGSDALSDGKRRLEKLKEIADYLGIRQSLLFTGFVNDIRPVIAMSDVIVCTSVVETFGRCVVEAMSCGKPVVASMVGGIPEIISDNSVGVLIQPRDIKGFANAVSNLLMNCELRTKLGRAARDHVVKKFGVTSHMKNLIKLYDNIMSKGTN